MQSELKHTKGKWVIKPSLQTSKKRTEIWVDGDIDMTFEIVHNETSVIESEANAKLIEAAPFMLAALQTFIRREEKGWHINLGWKSDSLDLIRDAIDKATKH